MYPLSVLPHCLAQCRSGLAQSAHPGTPASAQLLRVLSPPCTPWWPPVPSPPLHASCRPCCPSLPQTAQAKLKGGPGGGGTARQRVHGRQSHSRGRCQCKPRPRLAAPARFSFSAATSCVQWVMSLTRSCVPTDATDATDPAVMFPMDGLMATDRSDADTNDDCVSDPVALSRRDTDPALAPTPPRGVLPDDMVSDRLLGPHEQGTNARRQARYGGGRAEAHQHQNRRSRVWGPPSLPTVVGESLPAHHGKAGRGATELYHTTTRRVHTAPRYASPHQRVLHPCFRPHSSPTPVPRGSSSAHFVTVARAVTRIVRPLGALEV